MGEMGIIYTAMHLFSQLLNMYIVFLIIFCINAAAPIKTYLLYWRKTYLMKDDM